MGKVMVTGAGGFIGSHVVEAFLEAGYAVRALVHYSSSGRFGHLERSAAAQAAEREGKLEVVLGDVTDPYQVSAAVRDCPMVVHLAALIGIPYSYVAPASYLAVNAGGTLNILEAARRHGARRVVVTSTSEVYGTALSVPIEETHPLQAQSPYAASKIAADKLAESYWRSFDLPVVTLRPFNTFGPRQSRRALLPTILTQVLSGAEEIMLGNLEPRRDLTFVTDTARAFLLAATVPGIEGETIHCGTGQARSVGEVAALCLHAAGSDARLVVEPRRVRPEKSEVGLLVCNPARARRLLGWEPQVGIEEGLAWTLEYLRTSGEESIRPGDYVV